MSKKAVSIFAMNVAAPVGGQGQVCAGHPVAVPLAFLYHAWAIYKKGATAEREQRPGFAALADGILPPRRGEGSLLADLCHTFFAFVAPLVGTLPLVTLEEGP
jgi:hypothetical protein